MMVDELKTASFLEDATNIENAGPNQGLIFQISADDLPPFTPEFYPDRFNKTLSKKLNRNEQQCKGEDVSIKGLKNAELHATGVMLASEATTFTEIVKYNDSVNLITPISPNGGLEAYIKKGQLGEIEGYDPHSEEWKINYTVDFVGLGIDEYGDDNTNTIITEIL